MTMVLKLFLFSPGYFLIATFNRSTDLKIPLSAFLETFFADSNIMSWIDLLSLFTARFLFLGGAASTGKDTMDGLTLMFFTTTCACSPLISRARFTIRTNFRLFFLMGTPLDIIFDSMIVT